MVLEFLLASTLATGITFKEEISRASANNLPASVSTELTDIQKKLFKRAIKGEKRGIAFSHIDSIIKIIYSSHPNIIKVFYPVIVKKEYDKLRMTKKAILDIQDFSYTPDIPEVVAGEEDTP